MSLHTLYAVPEDGKEYGEFHFCCEECRRAYALWLMRIYGHGARFDIDPSHDLEWLGSGCDWCSGKYTRKAVTCGDSGE